MSRNPLLFEIGCEEIPARFFPALTQDLRKSVESAFAQHNLSFEKLTVFATYRRLGLLIEGLVDQQADQDEILKGPPASIGVSSDGKFLPAALGFAKKLGCSEQDLSVENNYVMARKFQKGKLTQTLLPSLLPSIIQSLSLPIAMRWGEGTHTFIRPIQWILCLFGKTHIPVTCFGITSDKYTYGHRFLTQNNLSDKTIWGVQLEINTPEDYEKTLLEKGKVMANPVTREADLLKQLNTHTSDLDPKLLNEVLYLVEYPTVLKGEFSEAFLELPSEVLVDCMTTNQKYFPLRENNHLQAAYLVAAENVTDQSKTNILKGNNNVLRARLNDMAFFWNEDQKQPLIAYLEKLKHMTYQKNMGTLYDKVERITALAQQLATIYLPQNSTITPEDIQKTAQLCKADLATHLVIESPILQGTMGKYYAKRQNFSDAIANGIEQHYWPRFAEDKLPEEITAVIVGIADRLDSLVATFETGYIPSGSQDPLGMRRTLFGLFKILLEQPQETSLSALFTLAYAQLGRRSTSQAKLEEFAEARLKSFLIEEKKLPYDCVEATLHFGRTKLKKTFSAAENLYNMRNTDTTLLKGITDSAVRVSKLAQKATTTTLEEKLFTMDEEKQVWTTLNGASEATCLDLNPALTAFFDKVLVMDKDPQIQQNRLALLKNVHNFYYEIADFSKLVL